MTESGRADIPTWECYELVARCSVGRLCFMDGDTPIAYPVSFKLHQSEAGAHVVIIRTGAASLIAAHSGPASFEVDDIDIETRTAWSVLLRGTTHRIYDPANLPTPEPWFGEGIRVWTQLDVSSATGRRFVGTRGNDGFAVDWALYTPNS
jgi:uncharacterized protein